MAGGTASRCDDAPTGNEPTADAFGRGHGRFEVQVVDPIPALPLGEMFWDTRCARRKWQGCDS